MSALNTIFAEMNLPAPGANTDILAEDFSLPENEKGIAKLFLQLQLAVASVVNLVARRKTGPTKATGTIAVVAGSLLVDGDDFTLDDGSNPAVNFEFDTNDAITGDVALPITGAESENQIAHLVAEAINATANLDISAEVDDETDEVLLTHEVGGSDGNQAILEAVTDAGFTVTGMAGGLDDGEVVMPLEGGEEIPAGEPQLLQSLIHSDHSYNLQVETDGIIEVLYLASSKDGA
ncbi:MAG: hypothetical protein ACRD1X_12385 [Vicinamibacteria bacterium]